MRMRDLLPVTIASDLQSAALITAIGCALGLASNALRSDQLPLIASQPYRVLVPCPEPGGPVDALAPDAVELDDPGTFLVDARDETRAAAEEIPGAHNLPFDYLDATPPEVLQSLADTLAANRVHRVVVVGDGQSPDSGEQLARELSAAGILNLFYVEGGAPALRAQQAGRPGQGQAP